VAQYKRWTWPAANLQFRVCLHQGVVGLHVLLWHTEQYLVLRAPVLVPPSRCTGQPIHVLNLVGLKQNQPETSLKATLPPDLGWSNPTSRISTAWRCIFDCVRTLHKRAELHRTVQLQHAAPAADLVQYVD
jgi:hypothetical protein